MCSMLQIFIVGRAGSMLQIFIVGRARVAVYLSSIKRSTAADGGNCRGEMHAARAEY